MNERTARSSLKTSLSSPAHLRRISVLLLQRSDAKIACFRLGALSPRENGGNRQSKIRSLLAVDVFSQVIMIQRRVFAALPARMSA